MKSIQFIPTFVQTKNVRTFGALMDGGHYPALWLGVAIFQALAMFVALRVGRLNFA